MKKVILILFLSALCIFLLSACGKKDNATVDTDNTVEDVNGGESEAPDKEPGDDDVEEHVHKFGEWEILLSPTCFEKGERIRLCECGEEDREIVSALGHNTVKHEGLAATCTQDGYEAYETCTRCGYSTKKIINALGHDIHDYEELKPTCTSVGHNAYESCSRCDYSTYIEIDKTAHTYGDWIIKTAPLCEEEGMKIKECTHCGLMLDSEELPPIGHDYGDWQVISEATCTSGGMEVCICANDVTHTQIRYTDKKEHVQGEWEIKFEPTCEEAGEKVLLCTECNSVIQTLKIEPTGHRLVWSCDEECHVRKCELCGSETEEAKHEFENNVCTVCGYVNQFAQEGLSYKLIDDKSYAVTGIGFETDEKITIPATYNGRPVTEISDYAFRNCTFEEIVIPESITRIGVGAFYNCVNLETITLPFIGISADEDEYAFLGIIFGAAEYSENSEYIPEALKTVILSEGMEEVPRYALFGCKNIENVILPETLITIGNSAFAYCTGLKTLIIPERAEYIDIYAFCGCTVEGIVFDNKEGWTICDVNGSCYGEVDVSDSALAAVGLCNVYTDYVWKRV